MTNATIPNEATDAIIEPLREMENHIIRMEGVAALLCWLSAAEANEACPGANCITHHTKEDALMLVQSVVQDASSALACHHKAAWKAIAALRGKPQTA